MIRKEICWKYHQNRMEHCRVGTHQHQEKRQEGENKQVRRAKNKGIEVQRVNVSSPTQAIDVLIWEKEKMGGKKWKKQGVGLPTKLPWTTWSTPATHRDHMVSLFFYTLPSPQERGWPKKKKIEKFGIRMNAFQGQNQRVWLRYK